MKEHLDNDLPSNFEIMYFRWLQVRLKYICKFALIFSFVQEKKNSFLFVITYLIFLFFKLSLFFILSFELLIQS